MAATVTTLVAGPQLASGEDVFAFSSVPKSGEYICSEPTCASVTIPMQAPKAIILTASNHTAVEVAWDPQSTNDNSDVFFACVDGLKANHCCGERNESKCTITNLLPRTPYKVCVQACQPNTTASSLVRGSPLVSSGDVISFSSNLESDKYICSEPTCTSVTIAMQAPNNIILTASNHTAVEVAWDAPSIKDDSDVFAAYIKGLDANKCQGEQNESKCTIGSLLPLTPYTVCVLACHPNATMAATVTTLVAGPQLASGEDVFAFSSVPKSGEYICSEPTCASVTIPMQVADNLLTKILLGIFIPLIIIILLVLLFVFRKRIPFIRDLFDKESTAEDGESDTSRQESSPPFPIEYYAPPGPGTLSNVPPPIPIENFAANLRVLNANNGFQALFQTLNSLAASEIEEKYRLTKVAAAQNGNRNRYSDMPPYDQSLVLVGRPWSTVINDPQSQITVSEVEKGYVNASYVRRPEYGSGGEALVSSFSTRPAYIATQGPLKSTVTDFLTMVCQQRCPLIIMLCQSIEDGKIKCTQYWPDGMTSTFESEKCTVEVRKESEENLGSVIRRELKIHPSSEASPWTVTQFHYTGWVDNSVPNVESFYNLVVMQNDFSAEHPMGVECGPTVVHCSAGVGRTGTFMAARFLLDRLRTNPQNVDIVGTVLAMRKWRPNLVQVWSQLQFLYDFVDSCLGKENLGVKPIAPGPKALPAAPYVEYANNSRSSRPVARRGEASYRLQCMFKCRIYAYQPHHLT
ncbi:Receptor type tyrosine protein phosphatase O [Echinococcus multilocularis]|uniref:Receptor type tyrosine protein phosphatase O n=1 Tax=Echinococcus multilocularis TaxID=6211 RepID=A0A068YK97_ECHMU|nr:Receptor type tyrosine protein phosphatase O [Echinococcus multilocularis]